MNIYYQILCINVLKSWEIGGSIEVKKKSAVRTHRAVYSACECFVGQFTVCRAFFDLLQRKSSGS